MKRRRLALAAALLAVLLCGCGASEASAPPAADAALTDVPGSASDRDAGYAHLRGDTPCAEFLQQSNGLTAENSKEALS